MSRWPPPRVARDQIATPFGLTLTRFCDTTRALGAALVDQQGETVDYAGRLEAYEIRVSAAEWRLALDRTLACSSLDWAATTQLLVRGDRATYAIFPISEGYALVCRLTARSLLVSSRAVAEAVRELCREGGLPLPRAWAHARWSRVDVRTTPDARRRPIAVFREGAWRDLEILGRFAPESLGRRETGFRGRLGIGADFTLIREPMGIWYADGLPDV